MLTAAAVEVQRQWSLHQCSRQIIQPPNHYHHHTNILVAQSFTRRIWPRRLVTHNMQAATWPKLRKTATVRARKIIHQEFSIIHVTAFIARPKIRMVLRQRQIVIHYRRSVRELPVLGVSVDHQSQHPITTTTIIITTIIATVTITAAVAMCSSITGA